MSLEIVDYEGPLSGFDLSVSRVANLANGPVIVRRSVCIGGKTRYEYAVEGDGFCDRVESLEGGWPVLPEEGPQAKLIQRLKAELFAQPSRLSAAEEELLGKRYLNFLNKGGQIGKGEEGSK